MKKLGIDARKVLDASTAKDGYEAAFGNPKGQFFDHEWSNNRLYTAGQKYSEKGHLN
jgi:hypothetical protein